TTPDTWESLGSRKMQGILEPAKEQYDLVIFDTPPVLAVTDAQIMAEFVDGAMLVVRSKVTELYAATKAVEALKPAKARLLGTVLNDREKKGSNYYYYYGTN